MTFPFVRAAVEDDRLTLHGLWTTRAKAGWNSTIRSAAAFVPV
jgi:carbonic anhydrase